jgi:ABC-type multidrug transport system fused ATPase/permease subunit
MGRKLPWLPLSFLSCFLSSSCLVRHVFVCRRFGVLIGIASTAFALGVVFYFVGQFYIRSALAARQQVAISRSPLFTTLGDTAAGAVTIRAFQKQGDFESTFRHQTDVYNKVG